MEDRFPKETIGPTIVVDRKVGERTDAQPRASHDLLLRCDSVSTDLYSSTQVRNALRDGKDRLLHDRCSQRAATYLKEIFAKQEVNEALQENIVDVIKQFPEDFNPRSKGQLHPT